MVCLVQVCKSPIKSRVVQVLSIMGSQAESTFVQPQGVAFNPGEAADWMASAVRMEMGARSREVYGMRYY